MNWKVITGTLFLFIISNIAFDIDDPTNCPKGMSSSDKKTCCVNLRKKINVIPNTLCCPNYPRFVIWTWQFNLCLEFCGLPANRNYTRAQYLQKRCCHLPCCLRYLKIIDEQPEITGIDIEGFKFSYFLSTFNDTRWLDVINAAVDQCGSQYRLDIPPLPTNETQTKEIEIYDAFWDCFQLVPEYLYNIVDCIYFRNFLSCPVYNESIPLCPEWRAYTQDCLVDVTE